MLPFLLELKAFLAPADPREVHDKATALEKGVQQVERRRDGLRRDRESLNRVLRIDDTFALDFAVTSESSVGCGMARLGDVAVVRIWHLIDQIKLECNLRRVCEWLSSRAYLPVPGRDYEQVPYAVTIGNWTLDWYGIRSVAESYC